MALNPGQTRHPDQTDIETREAAEAVSEGDAVTLNSSGEVLAAGDTDTIYGVAGDDHISDGYEAGDEVSVVTQGPVVANVATGVGPSVELAGSATAGELAAGDSAKALVTKTAEGANLKESIPDGFAHVDV
jgi:hypothetical protein